jgi:colanic acid biosynthesis protein WcaH
MNNKIEEKLYRQCVDLLPIVTVDVLVFDEDLTQTVLFRRENKPLQGLYYSIGGRVYKNENILNTAIRISKSEADLELNKGDLIYGGVTEEIFHDSSFAGINAHNVNIFFGLIVKKEKLLIQCEEQHSAYKCFSIDDQNQHPYLSQKIFTLLTHLKQ